MTRSLCVHIISLMCLVGCAPAGDRSPFPELMPSQKPPRIGLLWWPANQADAADRPARDIEECLADKIATSCQGSELVRQETIRDLMFPLLEPATQPDSETAFLDLVAREDVQARLRERGVHYLVAFSGSTSEEGRGAIFCGGGYGGGGCFGMAWIVEDSQIDVVILDLDELDKVGRLEAGDEATTWLIPALVLPVPIPARTKAHACQQMGQQIIEYIQSRSHGEVCP